MFRKYALVINLISFVFKIILVSAQQMTNEATFRVVNGDEARLGAVPYQISFKRATSPRFFQSFCGGAIIKPMIVLSAAHCFAQDGNICSKPAVSSIRGIYAVAGNLNTNDYYGINEYNTNGQWRTLKHVNVLRQYVFPEADIAVVHVRKMFELNANVRTIPFATKNLDYGTMRCQISGYGKTALPTYTSRKPSSRLLIAHTKLINPSKCNREHNTNMEAFICAEYRVSATAQGDSGGPLVCKGTKDPAENDLGLLVGIVCGFAKPGGAIYTRVSTYKDFVARGSAHSILNSLIYVLIIKFALFLILNYVSL